MAPLPAMERPGAGLGRPRHWPDRPLRQPGRAGTRHTGSDRDRPGRSESRRIHWKVALLKPLCSAMLSIGSGGPFGAEGPVIGLGALPGFPAGPGPAGGRLGAQSAPLRGRRARASPRFSAAPPQPLLWPWNCFSSSSARCPSPPWAWPSATASGCMRLAWVDTAPIFPITGVLATGDAWTPETSITPPWACPWAWPLSLHHQSRGGLRAQLRKAAFSLDVVASARRPGRGCHRSLGTGHPGPSGGIPARPSAAVLTAALASFVILKSLAWIIGLGSGTSSGSLAPLFPALGPP